MLTTMIKRRLFMGFAMSMVVLTVYRYSNDPDQKSGEQAEPKGFSPKRKNGRAVNQADFDRAVSITLNGTIVRRGEQFALREISGTLYPLDSTGRAWPFEGEDVRVTGHLDHVVRLIHIDRIDMLESESAA
jgi:hypothetical protein